MNHAAARMLMRSRRSSAIISSSSSLPTRTICPTPRTFQEAHNSLNQVGPITPSLFSSRQNNSSSSSSSSFFSTDERTQQQSSGSQSGGRRTAVPCHQVQIIEDDTATTSATEIVQPFFDQQEPIVLRGLLLQDPKNRSAVQQNFLDWDYWETEVSSETSCQVELGGKGYSNSDTAIADIPFVEFVQYLRFFEERFGRRRSRKNQQQTTTSGEAAASDDDDDDETVVVPTTNDLIYMAQNDIFDEILDDITIPDCCQQLGRQTSLYSTMIWIGPYGCTSPLHYDPLDNILMQYVGIKEIFLCSPQVNSSLLQVGTNDNQMNTSPLTPQEVMDSVSREGDNKDKLDDKLFQGTTLYPGDAIYIPKKWYHHVTTVETSVSINTWFR